MMMFSHPKAKCSKLSFNSRPELGMSLAEYGLIMGLVVIVAIPALTLMGNQTKDNINQVSQNSNQLNDMVNVLNAPMNGGSGQQGSARQENILVKGGNGSASSPLSVGGQNFGYQIGSDGKIRFTAQSGEATNTTSVDGSQMTQMALAELQQILNSPANDLSEEQKEDLQKLIEEANEIATAQSHLDSALKATSKKGRGGQVQMAMDNTLDSTRDLSMEANESFKENPKVMMLAKTIVTIAKQNYLANNTFIEQIPSTDKREDFSKNLVIPSSMLLTNISKEANHTDTQAATNQLETLNTASGG
jgi:hypothetical protein